jgi:hypothetical protein
MRSEDADASFIVKATTSVLPKAGKERSDVIVVVFVAYPLSKNEKPHSHRRTSVVPRRCRIKVRCVGTVFSAQLTNAINDARGAAGTQRNKRT